MTAHAVAGTPQRGYGHWVGLLRTCGWMALLTSANACEGHLSPHAYGRGDGGGSSADMGPIDPDAAAGAHCANLLSEIDTEWNTVRPDLKSFIADHTAGPRQLYDAQVLTSNFVWLSHATHNEQWLAQLAAVHQEAAAHLKVVSSHPMTHVGSVTLARPMKIWLDASGREVVLHSSQFLYPITLLLHGLGTHSALRDAAVTDDFFAAYLDVVVRDHLLRWVFATDASSGVFGGRWPACEGTTLYTHSEMVDRLASNVAGSYCNAVSDKELFIGAAALHIVALYDNNPALFELHAPAVAAEHIEALRAHAKAVMSLFLARFVYSAAVRDDDTPVEVAVFDPPAYHGYPDYDYSGYTGAAHPWDGQMLAKANKRGVGWDFSHARRFVLAFDSAMRVGSTAADTFADAALLTRALTAQSNSVAYRVYRGDDDRAAFANYMDGTDGWFRVGRSPSDALYGFEPGSWAQGRSFLTGGFGRWVAWAPKLETIWALSLERESEQETPRYTPIGRSPFDQLQIAAGSPEVVRCVAAK